MSERWIEPGQESVLAMPVPDWFKKKAVENDGELRQILAAHLRNLLETEEDEEASSKENAKARLEAVKGMLKELNGQNMALGANAQAIAEKEWGAIDDLLDGMDPLWERLLSMESVSYPIPIISEGDLNQGAAKSLGEWARQIVDWWQ